MATPQPAHTHVFTAREAPPIPHPPTYLERAEHPPSTPPSPRISPVLSAREAPSPMYLGHAKPPHPGLAARARCPRASPFSYGWKKQFFEGVFFLIFSGYVFFVFFAGVFFVFFQHQFFQFFRTPYFLLFSRVKYFVFFAWCFFIFSNAIFLFFHQN